MNKPNQGDEPVGQPWLGLLGCEDTKWVENWDPVHEFNCALDNMREDRDRLKDDIERTRQQQVDGADGSEETNDKLDDMQDRLEDLEASLARLTVNTEIHNSVWSEKQHTEKDNQPPRMRSILPSTWNTDMCLDVLTTMSLEKMFTDEEFDAVMSRGLGCRDARHKLSHGQLLKDLEFIRRAQILRIANAKNTRQEKKREAERVDGEWRFVAEHCTPLLLNLLEEYTSCTYTSVVLRLNLEVQAACALSCLIRFVEQKVSWEYNLSKMVDTLVEFIGVCEEPQNIAAACKVLEGVLLMKEDDTKSEYVLKSIFCEVLLAKWDTILEQSASCRFFRQRESPLYPHTPSQRFAGIVLCLCITHEALLPTVVSTLSPLVDKMLDTDDKILVDCGARIYGYLETNCDGSLGGLRNTSVAMDYLCSSENQALFSYGLASILSYLEKDIPNVDYFRQFVEDRRLLRHFPRLLCHDDPDTRSMACEILARFIHFPEENEPERRFELGYMLAIPEMLRGFLHCLSFPPTTGDVLFIVEIAFYNGGSASHVEAVDYMVDQGFFSVLANTALQDDDIMTSNTTSFIFETIIDSLRECGVLKFLKERHPDFLAAVERVHRETPDALVFAIVQRFLETLRE